MSTFTIEIDTSSDALQQNLEAEIGQILRGLTAQVEEAWIPSSMVLRDSNGARVGTATFEEETDG